MVERTEWKVLYSMLCESSMRKAQPRLRPGYACLSGCELARLPIAAAAQLTEHSAYNHYMDLNAPASILLGFEKTVRAQ